MHEVKTSENGRDIFFERTKETGEDKLWDREGRCCRKLRTDGLFQREKKVSFEI